MARDRLEQATPALVARTGSSRPPRLSSRGPLSAKPAMFADARVPYFWRVERGEDDFPMVHELWLHHDMGLYVPAPERPAHTGKLVVDVPFPVEIDLRALVTR